MRKEKEVERRTEQGVNLTSFLKLSQATQMGTNHSPLYESSEPLFLRQGLGHDFEPIRIKILFQFMHVFKSKIFC